MWKSPEGYWRPEPGEEIILEETPHFIKYRGEKDGKSFRGMMIPFPRRDGLDVGTKFTVVSLLNAQDIHYEYVIVLPTVWVETGEVFPYWAENNITMLEIPQRYFKPSDIEYPNNYKSSYK